MHQTPFFAERESFLLEAPVWFSGTGPGHPDLATVRCVKLLSCADTILYNSGHIHTGLLEYAREGARHIHCSEIPIEETVSEMTRSAERGELALRLHAGDPSLFASMREERQLLEARGIKSRVIPGITAAFAAAAAGGVGFTTLQDVHSLSLVRQVGKHPIPEGQQVAALAAHGGAMCIYLADKDHLALTTALAEGGVPPETPVLMAERLGWPDERLEWTTAKNVGEDAKRLGVGWHSVFLVLPGQT
jgi:Precorrin-4 methylase